MIGNTIKQKRVQKGMTQTELGRKIGVTRDVIGNWERGSTSVPPEYAVPLSREFGCSVSMFLQIDQTTLDKYLSNYDATINLTDFAVANPDLMDMILFMSSKWDGDFPTIVLMAYYYCLLPADDRVHIAYLIGRLFRQKYEYNPNNNDLINKALDRIPEYIEQWHQLNMEADSLIRERRMKEQYGNA